MRKEEIIKGRFTPDQKGKWLNPVKRERLED